MESDILYSLKGSGIVPVLFSPLRPYLAVIPLSDGTLTGCASFGYTGALRVLPECLHKLLLHKTASIGASLIKPLQPNNVIEWKSNSPFKVSFPNSIVDRWEPMGTEAIDQHPWLATPLPVEYENIEKAEIFVSLRIPETYYLMNDFDRQMQGSLIRSTTEKFVYGIESYNEFSKNDLRIPVATIELLELPHSKPVNELHDVIQAVLTANPAETSKALWRIIREDNALDQPDYDKDEIIQKIDNISTGWISANGVYQQLKWSSFQTPIPKLKTKVARSLEPTE